MGKRRTLDDKLQKLSIGWEEFESYLKIFTEAREKYRFILKRKAGWVEFKHQWNEHLILDHLLRIKTVGLFPNTQIDYLMLDLDCHNTESLTSLIGRNRIVKEAFDGDPLSYQSSISGGIRICYFLSKPWPRELVFSWAERRLLRVGAELRPGEIEIRAAKNGDRLPFGEGSELVDPFTLEPIHHLTLKEEIRYADCVWQHQKLEIDLKPADLFIRELRTCGAGQFSLTVARLYEEGLFPEITTNEAFLKLSWDLLVRQSFPKEEAKRYLRSWIRQKHNGLSNRFNKGRLDLLDKHIKRVISTTNPGLASYRGSKHSRRDKRLSLTDAERIVNLIKDSKLQLATFSLLEYCLNFGKESKEKKEIISNLYGAGQSPVTYGAELGQNIPGLRSKESFYCPISKQTLRHLPGFDKSNPRSTLLQVIDLKLISLKRNAYLAAHKCREYWVHFPFDGSDPTKVVSLDEAKSFLGADYRSSPGTIFIEKQILSCPIRSLGCL